MERNKEIRDEEIVKDLERRMIITKKRRVKWFVWSALGMVLFAFCFSSLYHQNLSIPAISFLLPTALFVGIGSAWAGPKFENLIIHARMILRYKKEVRLEEEVK
jgi:hypothetical protein